MPSFESRSENGVVEAGVHLEERVWKLGKFAMPPTIAAR